MPMLLAGSTTSVTATLASQALTLSALAKAASRVQICNQSGGLVFVRITTAASPVAATIQDIPVPITQNNPFVVDKKAGDDAISILGTVASGTVYVTGVDGFQ
jgi:hypothetical protein